MADTYRSTQVATLAYPPFRHPSAVRAEDLDVTDAEMGVLTAVASSPVRALYGSGTRADRRIERLLPALAARGLVHYVDAATGRWERGMWAAHQTCLGLNVAYRAHDDAHLGHPDCNGRWQPDGSCTGCSAARPLDRTAYDAYLVTLGTDDRARQISGPRLWCREHGWMRRGHITTKKVCMQRGTDAHDGGLDRV